MSREHEPPDDPRSGAGHDPHQEHLAEIERQLRRARPTPPRLDLAAIETLARETLVPKDPSPVEEPHVVLKPPTDADRRSWRVRSYTSVAGSWICGAIVGAVAMFLYEGRDETTVDPHVQMPSIATDATNTVTTNPRETPEDVRQQPNADLAVATNEVSTDAPNFSWLVSARTFDPYGRGDRRGGGESVTWRAGMCLPGFAARPSDDVDINPNATRASLPDGPASEVVSPPEQRRDHEPTPDITRERLLRELMRDTSAPIL